MAAQQDNRPFLKPLPTVYRGVTFRSRTEARWAVCFDTIGWSWEYEPEAFDLGDGVLYLPDFWLPAVGWFEVKGREPTDEELERRSRLCAATGQMVLLAVGPPQVEDQIIVWRAGDNNEVNAWRFCFCEDRKNLAFRLKDLAGTWAFAIGPGEHSDNYPMDGTPGHAAAAAYQFRVRA